MEDIDTGEKDLELLLRPAKVRKAYDMVEPVACALKVDGQGNLSYRFDVKTVYKNVPPPAFYEYKTLTELRNAMPQLLKEEGEPSSVCVDWFGMPSFSEVSSKSDQVVVGTVTGMEFHSVRVRAAAKQWVTVVKVKVEEIRRGDAKEGQTIEIFIKGAPGKYIFTDFEYDGSYPIEGNRYLFCLRTPQLRKIDPDNYNPIDKLINKLIQERNPLTIYSSFNSIMAIDDNGALSPRKK